MKMNNKGLTLAEIMVSLLIVAVFLLFGASFFLNAFKHSYAYQDVVYNVDTAVNILEKQKRSAAARQADGSPYVLGDNLTNTYSANPNNSNSGKTAYYASGLKFVEGGGDSSTAGTDLKKLPALLEVNYVAVFPVEDAPAWNSGNTTFLERIAMAMGLNSSTNKPKYVIALKTYYASNMYENPSQ